MEFIFPESYSRVGVPKTWVKSFIPKEDTHVDDKSPSEDVGPN